MNKKNFLYTFVGVLIGIGITLGVAYYIIDDTVTNYSDEAQTLASVLEKSKDPVLQKNYVLAGLTLSGDFQTYLEYGVQNGWWTEEFLAQVLIDDVIPVYLAQYAGTLKLIASTDSFKDIQAKLGDLKTFISNLPLDKIAYLINRLLSISLPNIDGLKAKLAALGSIRVQISDALNNLKNVISGLIDQLNALEEQFPQFKEKIEDLKNALLNLNVALDNIAAWIPTFYQHIQDILAQLAIIQQQLEDILLIIQNVSSYIPDITQAINEIRNVIAVIQGLFSNTDADFEFVEGVNTILGQSFTLTRIQALILNAIDITIVIDTYDNNGSPLNPYDDTLVIGQIYVAFESTGNTGMDIVLGNITITGMPAWFINGNVNAINNLI